MCWVCVPYTQTHYPCPEVILILTSCTFVVYRSLCVEAHNRQLKNSSGCLPTFDDFRGHMDQNLLHWVKVWVRSTFFFLECYQYVFIVLWNFNVSYIVLTFQFNTRKYSRFLLKTRSHPHFMYCKQI